MRVKQVAGLNLGGLSVLLKELDEATNAKLGLVPLFLRSSFTKCCQDARANPRNPPPCSGGKSTSAGPPCLNSETFPQDKDQGARYRERTPVLVSLFQPQSVLRSMQSVLGVPRWANQISR